MKLINFDGVDVKLADEAFLIIPLRQLFEQDKSKGKEKFWQQISYLWFMCDPRSPYMYLTKEDEREAEVKAQEGLEDDWKAPTLLREAMSIYRSQTTTSQSLLLEGMRKGIDNLRRFLAEVDLFAVDEKTQKPIYQVATITSALKQIPELAKAVAEAEKALAKDFADDDKVRGNTDKAIGEDD